MFKHGEEFKLTTPATGSIGDDAEFLKLLGYAQGWADGKPVLSDMGAQGVYSKKLIAYVDALLDARTPAGNTSQGVVPDGWQIVPKEPDSSMLYAGQCDAWHYPTHEVMRQSWAAMLAAAPPPPAVPQGMPGSRKAQELLPKLHSLFNRVRNPGNIRIKCEEDSRTIGDASELCRTIINVAAAPPPPAAVAPGGPVVGSGMLGKPSK